MLSRCNQRNKKILKLVVLGVQVAALLIESFTAESAKIFQTRINTGLTLYFLLATDDTDFMLALW